MPLVEQVTKKMIPDEKGGWYWLKLDGKDWAPVEVKPASNGWPACINHCSFDVDVKEVGGEWGPQIFPPD